MFRRELATLYARDVKKLGGASLIAAAAVFGLSGCASPQPAPTVTVTVTETVTATPTVPVVATPLALGATAQFSNFSATVHSVQLESAPNAPAPQSAGNHWASVEVEGCNTGSQLVSVSGGPWQMVADDNRTFTMSSTGYSQFPEPDYGFGSGALNPGECKRGWITFAVNDGAQITTVRYQNDLGEGARWTL